MGCYRTINPSGPHSQGELISRSFGKCFQRRFTRRTGRIPGEQGSDRCLGARYSRGIHRSVGAREHARTNGVNRRPVARHRALDHERCSQSEGALLRGNGGNVSDGSRGMPDAKGGMIVTANYTSADPVAAREQAPHGEDTVIVGGK
jgi:hypothetical protein